MKPLSASSTSQRGAVLLVSLMILLIMTVLGIAGMSSTTMEEKMAANNQQQQQAFQAAETALRDAEDWLTDNVTKITDLGSFKGANGLYAVREISVGVPAAELDFNIYKSTDWETKGVESLSLLDNQAAPRYIIEYMGPISGDGGTALDLQIPSPVARYAFRITAIGWSVDGTARYLTWSHYARRLN